TTAQEGYSAQEISRIARNDNAQVKPRISGSNVVWQDYRNIPAGSYDDAQANADVYGRNIDTGDDFKVTDNHTAARPAISGNRVVYTDSRNKASSGLDIRGYNLDSGDVFDVVKRSGDQDYAAVDGDIVVWQDNRQGNWDIVGLNLDSDDDYDIASRDTDEKRPSIFNKKVAWEDYRKAPDQPDIYFRDLEAKQTTRVTENGDSRFPDISNDYVVYRTGTGDQQRIQLYTIATKERKTISSQRTTVNGGPRIAGNLVVWADRRNDEDDNVWAYDIANGVEFNVTRAEKNQVDPDLSNFTVVWSDGRGDSPPDIRGAQLTVPAAPTPTPTATPPPGSPPTVAHDNRYFVQTGYRVDNDTIWNYFSFRGRINNFGFPISRTFAFLGKPTQFFQRQVVQVGTNGNPEVMNLLDPGLMPYNQINFSTFPAFDQSLVATAPVPGQPGYDTAIIDYIRRNAPDSFANQPVNFFRTFSNQVTLSDAFPLGGGNPSLLPLLNLELSGTVTSRPAVEPANAAFVYQRFQRVIMHYDANCLCTQPLLLADYLKSIITGQNLPTDLDQAASNSRFYRQYNNSAQNGVNRPADLPATEMRFAFDPG
ncbi:MAG: hypothetical protein IT307_15285, partial [Chloroflexi bacterium]|nr:hypothetical protein [Chloroflexota bacterium]